MHCTPACRYHNRRSMLKKLMTSASWVRFLRTANCNFCTCFLTRKIIFELVEDYSMHIFRKILDNLILPPTYHLTELIIMDEYLRLLHAGPQLLSASFRWQYRKSSIMEVTHPLLHRCLPHFKLIASQQLMGKLPLAQVTVTCPLLNTGRDYVGSFEIKRGNTSRTTTKRSTVYLHDN